MPYLSCISFVFYNFLTAPEYGVNFFRQFVAVMNALDNRGKYATMLHQL